MFYKRLRITTKFILWFLVVALVPLAIATYISYRSSKGALEKEIANSLRAVADNKAYKIETYLAEREKNVNTLAHMAESIATIERFSQAFASGGINSPEYRAVEEEFRPFLTYYQKSFDYDNLFLINTGGDIVFSVKDRREATSLYEIALHRDSQLAKTFLRARESLRTEISDFEYSPAKKEAAVFITSPVFKGAELIGFVSLQMSNRRISELVQDYAGLGKTGETAVASKIGDEAVFITPLRFDSQAAFKRSIPFGSPEGLPIQKALKGQNGSGIDIDYHGKEVLTLWRYLPLFRWGMIVKIDTSEIFLSANRLRDTLSMISLALLVVVVIMAVIIANSISSPIKALTETSGIISGGDLNARASVSAEDEIGDLAQSFNHMTDSLVEAKANVEEQKKLLEKANKELDSFVYTASHDLRAPLRGIASFASFLEEDYKSKIDENGRDYIKEIREGTSRMDKLIEDLLLLSRISRIKNPYEDVNVNELLTAVIKRIEFDLKEKKVDLRVQENIPVVKCDRIKISEVFLNLVTNAIKFSSKNEKERPRVEIGYMDEGEFHKFFVRDNGIGIESKYHEDIFGIFKRLHTSKQYEGTGAGLSIVKRIIDDHGGRVWVESTIGKGATFFFTIPKVLKEEGTRETQEEKEKTKEEIS